MIVDNRVRDALDLHGLKLPAHPTVVNIEAEDYTNWSGDDALRVNVTLAGDTDEEKILGEEVIALKSAIQDSLRSHGITVFPYIFLRKAGPSEVESDED
ncbi:MAG: hypothetical protein K8T91_22350 [Planctomycetes bacterium]|nr:hypothetical protein [Planctomycetota bacterium]